MTRRRSAANHEYPCRGASPLDPFFLSDHVGWENRGRVPRRADSDVVVGPRGSGKDRVDHGQGREDLVGRPMEPSELGVGVGVRVESSADSGRLSGVGHK